MNLAVSHRLRVTILQSTDPDGTVNERFTAQSSAFNFYIQALAEGEPAGEPVPATEG